MSKRPPAQDCVHDRILQPSTTFLALPPEIHSLIASQLPYPDLLALTLTHPTFLDHPLVHTSKSSRVDWLIDRAMKRLPLPSQSRCRWSSDGEFVSNAEVVAILRRRRNHLECAEMFSKGKSSGTCFVVEGRDCFCLAEGVKDSQGERWTSRLGLRHRKHTLTAWKVGMETLSSWHGVFIAILLAAALWHVT